MSRKLEEQINFHVEEVNFTLENPDVFVKWIYKVVSANRATLDVINYIFCSDDYLLNINKEYLDHDYYTDIISFPYSESPDPLQGDIFISIDRVRENADVNMTSFENELLRVMAHGVLHFIGYKDKSEEEEKVMRRKEDEAILLFK